MSSRPVMPVEMGIWDRGSVVASEKACMAGGFSGDGERVLGDRDLSRLPAITERHDAALVRAVRSRRLHTGPCDTSRTSHEKLGSHRVRPSHRSLPRDAVPGQVLGTREPWSIWPMESLRAWV